jgi:hypothetical protein
MTGMFMGQIEEMRNALSLLALRQQKNCANGFA